MDDTAPAGRRKIQVRLSTLILTFIMAGLGVGILIGNAENRRLRSEIDRIKSKGGEAVFFQYGTDRGILAYRLNDNEADAFLAIVNADPTSREREPGGKPFGVFYAGNDAYYWYGEVISGSGSDGKPAIWSAPGFLRMDSTYANRKWDLEPEGYVELFQAFVGQETSSPTPQDGRNALSNEGNAIFNEGGTVQIFFEDGFKYTYRLKPEARDKVLAILNTPPVYRKAPANRRAWARFFVGNDEYEIEGNEIFSEDEDGNQKVWSDDGFRRMMRFAADSRIGPSSYDEYEKLFEAFMGKDLSAPKPPDAPKP